MDTEQQFDQVSRLAKLVADDVNHIARTANSSSLFADQLLLCAYAREPKLNQTLDIGVARQLYTCTSLSHLAETILQNESMVRKFLPARLFENEGHLKSNTDLRELVKTWVTLTVARSFCIARIRDKVEDSSAIATGFIDFLRKDQVTRTVTGPIENVHLAEEKFDLGEAGMLFAENRTLRPDPILPLNVLEKFIGPRGCFLKFQVETGPFEHANSFPLSDAIRFRLAALRLAFHPFTSFNHFLVEHASPWETPLQDSDFQSVFYTRPQKDLPSATLTTELNPLLVDFHKKLGSMNWHKPSPWRLGMDKLDSAIFKLESTSPDALLDLVIGLESIFSEPDSRQESTHKVAARAARFLEDTLQSRISAFRRLKKIYARRSALAHGRHWKIDEKTLPDVKDGIVLLAKALRKMVAESGTELDILSLDLE